MIAMGYPFGEKVDGIMKIAEVTTDTETGCLAFSAVMITGESMQEDLSAGDSFSMLLVEPVDLCFISYRTGEKTVLWEYNPEITENVRKESKRKAVESFIEGRDADIMDISEKTEMFKSDTYYEMVPEEMDYFVDMGKTKDYRRSGRMESANDILSNSDIVRRIRKNRTVESYFNEGRYQRFQKNAGLN